MKPITKLTEIKIGDLVTHDWEGGNQVYDNFDFDVEKSPSFRFDVGQIGMIIEFDKNKFPGAKIVTTDGRTGWINCRFFSLVK
jgi:hypothetical protein